MVSREDINTLARFGMISISHIVEGDATKSEKLEAIAEIIEIYEEAIEANTREESTHGGA